jgi:isopenicillin N synthase-like dioxygenase
MSDPAIPVIDIEPYRAGDPAGIRRVAEAVAAACQRIGFLVIAGHGIPDALVRRVFEVSLAFFDRPLPEKLALRSDDPGIPRGYSALASKSLGRTYGLDAPPDLREQFFVGPLDDWATDFRSFPGATKVYAPNVWPASPAEFREVFTAYYRVQERLARDLMRIFALALGLPEAWFDRAIDRHFSTARPTSIPSRPATRCQVSSAPGRTPISGASRSSRSTTRPEGCRSSCPTANGTTCARRRVNSSSISAT